MLYNYHTHTSRCNHAVGTDEDYVKAAIDAGYSVLGFSDHAPYKHISHPRARMEYEQLDDYISSILFLKEKYKDQIDIRLGLETEWYPGFYEEKKELLNKVDYLILGQHFQKPDGTGSYFAPCTDEDLELYCAQILEGLETGLFTYLCHPDVFMFRQKHFDETCEKISRKIIEKAVETNTPMEINLQGIRRGTAVFDNGKTEYYYPHKDFWKIAAEYPVTCIWGIDAHDPEWIRESAEDRRKAEEELKDLGLNILEDYRF